MRKLWEEKCVDRKVGVGLWEFNETESVPTDVLIQRRCAAILKIAAESSCCIGLSVIYNLSFSGSRWCFHYLGWKLFQYDSTLLSYCQLSLMGGFIDFPIRNCRFKSDTFWLFVHYGGWFPFMRRIPFFVLGYSFQCVPFQSHFIRYYIMDPDHFCN